MNWLEIVGGAIAGGGLRELVGLLVARRKALAETTTDELTNTEKAIVIWRETAERLAEKVDKLEAHIERLEETIKNFHSNNETR